MPPTPVSSSWFTRHPIVRFCIAGGINTGIDLGVFLLLYTFTDLPVLVGNLAAFVIAVTVSYLLNRQWVFKHPRAEERRTYFKEYGQFVAASTLSLAVSSAILVIGRSLAPAPVLKISASVVGPVLNYLMYRFVVFPARTRDVNPAEH